MTSEDGVMELEEQVAIGSRAKPGAVIRSAVPIDFLDSDELIKQDSADLLNFLRSKMGWCLGLSIG